MLSVSYYVAASLDGFIATKAGGVDWLDCVEVDGEDYGYAEFFNSVDGLLMGRATYDQARSFGPWLYGNKPCWVWTHRSLAADEPAIVATAAPPRTIVANAAAQGLQHLWLVGGGKLAALFQAEHLISQYIVSLVPVVLGDGIPLFANAGVLESLALQDAKPFASGLVQLTYVPQSRRHSSP